MAEDVWTRVHVSPGTVSAMVDGVLVVMDSEFRFLELDDVGAFIWHHIDDGAGIEEIALNVTMAYQVPLETAREDVATFLQQLQAERLVLLDAVTS